MDILKHCAVNNSPEFNILKALEECGEFSEVLIKIQTKRSDKRPELNEAIKEFGDVMYRGKIALMSLFPEATLKQLEQEIDSHIHMKLTKLKGYLVANKETKHL